jgi:hypothetical protein
MPRILLFLSGCCLKTEVIKQLYGFPSHVQAGKEALYINDSLMELLEK